MNVFSHLPALHILIVLSADPVNMSPCVGMSATAHTAASCPFNVITLRWLSHTLAVVSQEPLSKVPNLPAANVHTVKVGERRNKGKKEGD